MGPEGGRNNEQKEAYGGADFLHAPGGGDGFGPGLDCPRGLPKAGDH